MSIISNAITFDQKTGTFLTKKLQFWHKLTLTSNLHIKNQNIDLKPKFKFK